MKVTAVQEIVDGLKEAGVRFVSYLPDSWLRDVYWRVYQDPDFITIPVSNEGAGVGLCAGAWLGGMKAVMIMENTGLRMACDQLARLGLTMGIPIFMIMPYRGDVGDKDLFSPPHGWTMEPVLQALRIPYLIVREEGRIRQGIRRCLTTLSTTTYHVALILGAEVCVEDL